MSTGLIEPVVSDDNGSSSSYLIELFDKNGALFAFYVTHGSQTAAGSFSFIINLIASGYSLSKCLRVFG